MKFDYRFAIALATGLVIVITTIILIVVNVGKDEGPPASKSRLSEDKSDSGSVNSGGKLTGESQTTSPKSKILPDTSGNGNIGSAPQQGVKVSSKFEQQARTLLKEQIEFIGTCSPAFKDPEFATPFKEPQACCSSMLQHNSERFIQTPSYNPKMSATPEFLDRLHGVAWAALAGDAFGAAVEFQKPDQVLKTFPLNRTPTEYDASIWAPNWKGLWTDDSTAALCLAAAYVKSRFLDCKAHFESLRSWFTNQYMQVVNDFGPSTKSTLENREISKAGSTNGCIMRMWPNVFFYSLHPIEDAVDASAASATLTHAHTVCRDSSRLMAAIIWELLHGAKKEDIMSPSFKQRNAELWEQRKFATGKGKSVADLLEDPSKANFPAGKQNYEADEALRVALEAFHNTDNILDGFLYCVRKGVDTDTTATIYGQIAGAFYGKKHIADKFPWMIDSLYARPALSQLIDAMTILAQDHYAELPSDMTIFDANGNVVSFNHATLDKSLQNRP